MTDNQRLLGEYVASGSETAFRELVRRYTDLVYSTALRLVGRDTLLAEDVAQTVFIDLAKRAHKLGKEVLVGGWLHRHTCYVASNMMRAERRRQAREREAVQMNQLKDDAKAAAAEIGPLLPLLDQAINGLDDEDRAAILLRFYEQRGFREVGEALGSSEDAARMRVNRALERLQHALLRYGARSSAAALGTALAIEAVTAAPAGLASSLAGAALSSGAGAAGAPAVAWLTVTKLKAGLLGACLLVGVVTPLIQHRANAVLRQENESLRKQALHLEQLRTEDGRLSNLVAQANSLGAPGRADEGELLRLRGEVGVLRRRIKEQEALLNAGIKGEKPSTSGARSQPPEVPPENIFPKEQFAFAGYGSAENTFKTFMWAMVAGDKESLVRCFTAEEATIAAEKLYPEAVAKRSSKLMAEFRGFRLLKTHSLEDGSAGLGFYYEYDDQGVARGARFLKEGEEWKFAPGQNW